MYEAASRQSDVGLLEPQEAISVQDAIKMWTIWPAKAMGGRKRKGNNQSG